MYQGGGLILEKKLCLKVYDVTRYERFHQLPL